MGFLTTITIRNDSWHQIDNNKEKLWDTIKNANQKAHRNNMASIGSDIIVQPSYHADDHQLFVHFGNLVQNINPWTLEFDNLLQNNPNFLKDAVSIAEEMVKEAKRRIKEHEKQ